jgi:5-formyltetrahydrofolate cyclo-ligase
MLQETKARLRKEALARRDALTDRDERARRIHAAVLALPAWNEAKVISTYVGVGSEVPTVPLIEAAFAQGKRVGIPVVEGGVINLYRLDALDELAPAPFGILELRKELRRKPRRLMPTVVHLHLIPGVAFDKDGGRLGYGKGYYDGLLARVKPRVPTVALAFEAQRVDQVPMGPTDVRIQQVIWG